MPLGAQLSQTSPQIDETIRQRGRWSDVMLLY
jgi:hypothetical protein